MKKIIYLLLVIFILLATAMNVNADDVSFLSGIINEDQTIELYRPSVMGSYYNYSENNTNSTEYSVSFYSGIDELKKFYFEVIPTDYPGIYSPPYFAFEVAIPYNADKMVFNHLSNIMHEHYLSPNAPVISNLNVVPNGSYYSVSWSASDTDNDELSYNVYYSVNDGVFNLFLIEYDMTNLDIPDSIFSQGEIRIKVEACDSFNLAEIISAPFIVRNKPPLVFIFSPATGSAFTYGTNISFEGWIYDFDTENINDFSWNSDIDGDIGNTSYLLTNLSEGEHKITLISSDGQFNSNDSIDITITNETRPDLKVENIWAYPEEPLAGNNVTIITTIHNIIIDAYFIVTFYDGEPSNGGVLIAEQFGYAAANGFTEIYALWESVPSGRHNIYAVISNASPEESNLSNNIGSIILDVSLPVSECQELTETEATYILIDDIITNSTCFAVQANNITLDFNSHSITGDYNPRNYLATQGDYGVDITNYSNTAIKNGAIYNFQHGVYLQDSQDNEITNMIINSNNLYGIYLTESSDNTISRNTLNYNQGGGGVSLSSNSENNVFTYNMMTTGNSEGIVILSGTNNGQILEYNTILNCYGGGINLGSYNQLTGNTVNGYANGISVASNNILINNTANSNTGTPLSAGIYLGGSNNTLIGNTANSNDYGIYLDSSSYNLIQSNTALDNNNVDFSCISSSGNYGDGNIFANVQACGDGWPTSLDYENCTGSLGCNGADINKDGKVGFSDFQTYLDNNGKQNCTEPDWCNGADINKDGKVGFSDFQIYLDNNGRTDCSDS